MYTVINTKIVGVQKVLHTYEELEKEFEGIDFPNDTYIHYHTEDGIEYLIQRWEVYTVS